MALWTVYLGFAAIFVPIDLLLGDRGWLIGALTVSLLLALLSRPSQSQLTRLLVTEAIKEAITDTNTGNDRALNRGFVDMLDEMLVSRDEAAGHPRKPSACP